jgi:glycosyltransferase involved in cell wall biosynthesis
MRILCVTNLFPNPAQPGRGSFNWRQLKLLGQQHHLRVLSPVPWTEELRFLREMPFFADSKWRHWDGINVAWCRYYYTPLLLREWYGHFLERSIRSAFHKSVVSFRPELVYATWAYPDGWAALRLARQFALPFVVKVHGSDLFLLDRFPQRKPGTADVMRTADAIIGVGQALCDAAVKLGARQERCHVVHEGTDRNLFQPGDQRSARIELGLPFDTARLLFVGNLVSVKRVNHLIEACYLLRESGLRFEVDIIGDGPLRNALKRQVGSVALNNVVHLRGRRSQAELPKWYQAANAFVLPSDSEGVPNVLVEAAGCGTPFVATAVGCIPEIAHMVRSELVPPGDPVALARGIRILLSRSARTPEVVAASTVPSVTDGVNATVAVFRHVLSARKPETLRNSMSPALD